MKKLIGAALLASAAIAGTTGAASAEGAFSGSVSMATDYVFRGISQTEGNPAIQGSIDYTNGIFYAGVWGSSLSFAPLETDIYAGFKPTTGPVSWDLGVLGYFYPGADDDGAEFDYYEGKIAASLPVSEAFSVGGAVFYSPEFFGDTGEGLYYEVNGGFTASEALSFSASYGVQDVDDYGDSYSVYSVGAKYALEGFTLGLTFTDTEDAFENGYAVDESDADETFVLSIGRAL